MANRLINFLISLIGCSMCNQLTRHTVASGIRAYLSGTEVPCLIMSFSPLLHNAILAVSLDTTGPFSHSHSTTIAGMSNAAQTMPQRGKNGHRKSKFRDWPIAKNMHGLPLLWLTGLQNLEKFAMKNWAVIINTHAKAHALQIQFSTVFWTIIIITTTAAWSRSFELN